MNRKGDVEGMIKLLIMVLIIIAIFATMWIVGKKIIISAIQNTFA